MAAYNRWMNERLYRVCSEMTDAERKHDRRAFFRSLHGTLNHLLVGDKIWMARFTKTSVSVSSLDQELFSDFQELRNARAETDSEIERWAARITEEELGGILEYTSMVNPEPRRYPLWLAVTHFFNHQTHHRGQLTTLLSQFSKDYGVTDLIWLPGSELKKVT
jgi:uncharacterized damage-inducible protein DinB